MFDVRKGSVQPEGWNAPPTPASAVATAAGAAPSSPAFQARVVKAIQPRSAGGMFGGMSAASRPTPSNPNPSTMRGAFTAANLSKPAAATAAIAAAAPVAVTVAVATAVVPILAQAPGMVDDGSNDDVGIAEEGGMASTVRATAAVGTGGSAAMSSVARSGSTFAAAMITGGKRPSPEVCHT